MDSFLEGYELMMKRPDIAEEAWAQQDSFEQYTHRNLVWDRGLIAGSVATLFGVYLLAYRSKA